jgi:hypothetical protein
MPARFTIESTGGPIVDRTLSRLDRNISDWTGAWPSVEDALLNAETKQFNSEGSYGAGGWKRVTDEWLTFKKTHGLDTRTGHATLKLRNSLTVKDAHDGVRLATSSSFVFGTSVPYAEHFSKVRPLTQLPEGARREVTRQLQRWAMRGIGSEAVA